MCSAQRLVCLRLVTVRQALHQKSMTLIAALLNVDNSCVDMGMCPTPGSFSNENPMPLQALIVMIWVVITFGLYSLKFFQKPKK